MNLDILVAGTGRCGSSFVSMILHQDFNICMGHTLNKKEPNDKDWNTGFHRWGIWEYKTGVTNFFIVDDTYITPIEKVLAYMAASHNNCNRRLKGIKAPFLSQLTREKWLKVHEVFNTKLVIWPWRSAEDTIHSKLKRRKIVTPEKRKGTTMWVNRGLEYMEVAFNNAPFEVLKIDFTNEVSREELIHTLAPEIARLR